MKDQNLNNNIFFCGKGEYLVFVTEILTSEEPQIQTTTHPVPHFNRGNAICVEVQER